MFSALIEIEEQKIYHQFEVPSLYIYCVDILGLPPHTAYDFIDVIRTSKMVPELAEAILQGRTTISKARRVCSVITPGNHKAWIDLASACSHRIVQKAVATANPRAAVAESLKYVSGEVLELKLAVSEEFSELLTEIKDLMSQQKRRAISTEEALFRLMGEYKVKNHPVMRAERATIRKAKSRARLGENSAVNRPSKISIDASPRSQTGGSPARQIGNLATTPPSRYRPMSVEHEVDLRDQNQCAAVDIKGKRCASKRWLEKHHVTECSHGGEHTAENLETLCSAHHRMRHGHRSANERDTTATH